MTCGHDDSTINIVMGIIIIIIKKVSAVDLWNYFNTGTVVKFVQCYRSLE